MKQARNFLHPWSLHSLWNCVPPVRDEKQQAPSGSPCWQQAGSGCQIQEPAIQTGQFSLSAHQPLAERFGAGVIIFACSRVALTV